MSFQTLHSNLVTLVDSVTNIQDVVGRPSFEFDGYPGAYVAESGNENEYDTTQDNLRTYAFNIWIFEKFDSTDHGVDVAYQSLRNCVDAVIDKLDEQENPESSRSLATGLGAGRTLVAVVAQPSRFAYDEQEKLIGAQIVVRLKVLVDLTVLS